MSGSTAVRVACVACFGMWVSSCASRTPPAVPPVVPAPAPETAPAAPAPADEPPPPSPVLRPEPTTDPPTPPVADCGLGTPVGQPVRTVALDGTLDPTHAPRPSNASERLVFRQLYDTLVWVDCEGQVRPGLAATWRRHRSNRGWVVTLDDAARFTDGAQVTAEDVVGSWRDPSNPDAFRGAARGRIVSATVISRLVLQITPRDDAAEAPLALAAPGLAVVRPGAGSPWPIGTTGYRVVNYRAPRGSIPGTVVVARVPDDPDEVTSASIDGVRFLVVPRSDPRDRLDGSVDLMVSRDPAALAYAATLSDFTSVSLPWLRTHVAVSPLRGRVAARAVTAEMRARFAADAVRGDARGAARPFWWASVRGCRLPATVPTAVAPLDVAAAPRVVFRASDPVAAEIAARLVGLVAVEGPAASRLLGALFPMGARRLTSVGLDDAAFDAALARGTDALYLVGLELRPLDPCGRLEALLGRAPWLTTPGTDRDAAIVPLVDTRARAILRRGRGGVALDWDGGLTLVGRERRQ